MEPKKLLIGVMMIYAHTYCCAQFLPEIQHFGGGSLDSMWSLGDSTFCKGGTLKIGGRYFVRHAPGEQWDSTVVWLGGFLTGNKCTTLSLNATQGGQSDTITVQLPDTYKADTCLDLTLIRYTSGLFGTIPAAITDTICLVGGFAKFTIPQETFFCVGDTSPRLKFDFRPPGSFINASGNPGLLIQTNGSIPLHSGAIGTNQEIQLVSGHPVCPDTVSLHVSIAGKQLPSLGLVGWSAAYCPWGTAAVDTSLLWPKGGRFLASAPGMVLADDSLGIINLGASQPGNYELMYSVDAPCFDTAKIPIQILSRDTASVHYPIFSTGGVQRLCQDDAPVGPVFTFGASGGTFVALPNTLQLDSNGVIYPGPSQPNHYSIEYITPGPCHDTVHAALNLRLDTAKNPFFDFIPDQVCGDDSIIPLDTVADFGYLEVLRGNQFVTATVLPQLFVRNSLAPGYTYLIRHVQTGYCADTAVDFLTVKHPDTAEFAYDPALFCLNSPDPLPLITGTGGGIFSAVSLSTSVNPNGRLDLANSGPGQHIIQYTTLGLCPDSLLDTVQIETSISALFNYQSNVFCQTAPNPMALILNVGGVFSADTFGLALDSLSGEIDLANSLPGTYSVTYTFSGSCEDTYTQTVSVLAFDSTTHIQFAQDTFCVDSAAPIPILSGDSSGAYFGSPGLVFFNPANGSVDLTRTPPGSYSVTFDLENICATNPADTLVVSNAPEAFFSYPVDNVCTGDATLTCQSNPQSFISGAFSGPSGIVIDSSGTIYPSQSQPGAYEVVFISGGTCKAVETADLAIYPLPQNVTLIPSDTVLCENEDLQVRIAAPDGVAFRLFQNGSLADSGAIFFTLDTLKNSSSFLAEVENAFGCTASDSVWIQVNPRPSVSAQLPEGEVSTGGEQTIILLIEPDATSVSWRLLAGDAVLDSGMTPPLPNTSSIPLGVSLHEGGLSPVIYSIQLVPEAEGCFGDTVTIPLETLYDPIFIPQVFTPNGDGQNDSWQVRWTSSIDPKDYELLVFNRAGGQVARIAPLGSYWDGGNLPDGVYWWTLRDLSGQEIRSGGLTIRRK